LEFKDYYQTPSVGPRRHGGGHQESFPQARAPVPLGLERDFDAVPELAALVADVLEEMDELRARLRRAGLG
jgi:chaperone modulatory protein CbpM